MNLFQVRSSSEEAFWATSRFGCRDLTRHSCSLLLSLDNGFNKARSKSEIDLVLSPIQEGHQATNKRSTIPAIGSPSSPSSFFAQSQSSMILKEHLAQNLAPHKAPTLAIMPHPSMKGR